MAINLKVVIAGGGIAGLTLANALEQANIDYVLLERRNEIAPQVGASIGILSNGCRILDQLGCREALYACIEPVLWVYDRDKHGRLMSKASGVSQLMKARSGYSFAFTDRQNVLEILYNNLKDKSKILLGKKSTTIRHHEDGVTVVCEDGSSYVGDILAGADGVNSKARSEIWGLAGEQNPDLVKNDQNAIECQYRCLYGIASSSSGLAPGEIDIGYNDKRSTVAIVGKDDRTYYFVFEKLDKTYKSPHIPTYTDADKDEYVKRHGGLRITDRILFRDLHKNSVSSTLVGLETAVYKVWTRGRIACLGDSVHKMTPNAGFGGNQAMESAAALANSIKKLSDKSNGQRLTQEQIVACLQDYQKSREVRAAAAVEVSSFITHVQALATWGHSLFARYGMKYAGDFLENMTSDGTVGAIRIDYLPLPKLSLQGNMPFNPKQGEGNKENLFIRALFASPFLVIFAFAWTLLSPTLLTNTGTSINSAWFSTVFPSSSLTGTTLGIESNTTSSTSLGNVYDTASSTLDSAAGVRTANYLAYFGVVLAIWSIEAVRSCNALMPVQLPALFALFAQQKGLGVATALYYFLHWVLTPIETFKSTDLRLTKLHYTRTILPSLLMVYYLPLLQSHLLSEMSQREIWLQIWQLFPVTLSLAQLAISKFWKDTSNHDKLHAPKRDVSTIRYTVGISTVICTMIWLRALLTSTSSISQFFLPGHISTSLPDSSISASHILAYNYILTIVSSYLWLVYFIWDAKVAGMVSQNWFTVLLVMAVGTVVLGPGGVVGAGFLWREYVITERRHWAALTEERVREKDMEKVV